MNERPAPSVIECVAPATSQVIGHVRVASADDVRQAVARAQTAQRSWGSLSVEERARRLTAFHDRLLDASDELTDALALECGKPRQEAVLVEQFPLLALVSRYLRSAPEVLAPKELTLDLFKHRRSRILYQPKGVIGVISPWNFPLLIPFGDAFTALIAGNAVVLKPSEHAPLIAMKVKRLWDEAGLDPDLLQIVPGRGDTGQALIQSGVQKIVFTGGVETGRRVAASCGEALVECVMELGGKAPAIVCDDADLELTARALVFGGFMNAGQACISVERVLVQESIHDELVERILTRTRQLRVGGPEGVWDVGPLIYPPQLAHVEDLIRDAVEKGAKLLTGGERPPEREHFLRPTVLVDCKPGMRILQEEIFGPVLPIVKVRDDRHALEIANSIDLGLSGYVFSRNAQRARQLAEELEVGSVVINDFGTDYGSPEVPFGGIKNSGFGRVHGDEALRAMCHVKHVSEGRLPPLSFAWFPYSAQGITWGQRLLRTVFSRKSLLSRIIGKI